MNILISPESIPGSRTLQRLISSSTPTSIASAPRLFFPCTYSTFTEPDKCVNRQPCVSLAAICEFEAFQPAKFRTCALHENNSHVESRTSHILSRTIDQAGSLSHRRTTTIAFSFNASGCYLHLSTPTRHLVARPYISYNSLPGHPSSSTFLPPLSYPLKPQQQFENLEYSGSAERTWGGLELTQVEKSHLDGCKIKFIIF